MRLAGPQVLSNTRQADQIHIDAGGIEQNQGKAAERFESDRLIKRLEKLRKDKTTLESQLKAVDDEIGTIQKRLDELAKK